MLSLSAVKASSVINIAGVSPNSSEFKRLVNEATELLMRRGDFEGTVVPIYTCVHNGCVVWPRYVGRIRQLNHCNRHIPIGNMWWDFLPYERRHGWHSNEWWGWLGNRSSVVNQGHSPLFQDILGEGRTVRAYNESPLDNNKGVWIFGEDNNGQRLMTKGIGPWKDGLQLVFKAGSAYAETPINVRRIERVIKDETNGAVRLYAWNSSASVLEELAYYEPSETHPNYVRSRITLPSLSCDAKGIIALVKLQFIPVKADTDLVLIDNLLALKYAIQSVRAQEAENTAKATEMLILAVDELNKELADANPETQTPVDLGAMGHNQHYLGGQHCF
jgi:hypothetical protein